MQSWENYLFYIMIASYFISTVAYWLWIASKKELPGKVGLVLASIGFVANTAAIILRMVIAKRAPLTNGYEFILTFTWGITAVFLFSEFRYKLKALGAFVMPVAFLLLAFIVLTMSPTDRMAQSIPPALKSQWLTFHVITAIISYGAFASAFGLGIMYLLKHSKMKDKDYTGWLTRVPEIDVLDELAYKFIGFGFPFLTLCIITGAIWANYAWGTYWTWDPKETWSLITWLVYAAYLHARLMYGWKGKRAAWLAVLGFVAVLFTFFGVNYFLPGLHSYATA